jgi:ABC-type nitrate/sulfonate/bicarbonate transport system ATPase subunit
VGAEILALRASCRIGPQHTRGDCISRGGTAPNRHDTGPTCPRSGGEVALIWDTISHYSPVLIAPLAINSLRRRVQFFLACVAAGPRGKGEVQLQRGTKMCVVPQRPYIPLGSLLRAAAYPTPAEAVDREEVVKALKLVGLGHFVDRLDEDIPWEQTLSGGEKQRLAFARLLVARPNIVLMDEATSALDLSSQKHLMELIHKRLHAATIIGVGHRPELESFYGRKLVLESRHDGARLVRDVDLTRVAALPRRRDMLVKFDRSLRACSSVSHQSANQQHRCDLQRRLLAAEFRVVGRGRRPVAASYNLHLE